MKKIISMIVSLAMLTSISVTAVEAEENENKDTTVKIINFMSLEENILEKNMTIKINENAVNSLFSNYSISRDVEDDLEEDIEILESQHASYSITNPTYDDIGTPVNAADPDLVKIYSNINTILTYLRGVNVSNLATLTSNIRAMEKQLESINDQQVDMLRGIQTMQVQSEMTNKQMVWAGESLLLAYDSINAQEKSIYNNRAILEKQLKMLVAQEELGLANKLDIEAIDLKLEDLDLAKAILEETKKNIKGQLNLLLSQPFDNPLEIDFTIGINTKKLNSMDIEEDLIAAIDNSYTLSMNKYDIEEKTNTLNEVEDDEGKYSNEYTVAKNDLENEELKQEDAERQLKLSFEKLYEEVKNLEKTLALENKKLDNERSKKNMATLRYNLGLISGIEYENLKMAYDNQEIKVETTRGDLFKAYRKYEWLLNGISVQ